METQIEKVKSVNNNGMFILLGSVIIAAAILLGFKNFAPAKNTNFVDPDSIFQGRPLAANEFLQGDGKEKVILLEYSDLECPFCKKLHLETMGAIEAKYKGLIGLAYRHFPLDFHPKAKSEAVASLCAREVGGQVAYKKFIDKTFEITPANNGLEPLQIPIIASSTGISMEKWNNCMNDASSTAAKNLEIENDTQDGLEVGVGGTPNILVLVKSDLGYRILTVIDGARNEKYFSAVIDQALKY